jgi:hypothetical protein
VGPGACALREPEVLAAGFGLDEAVTARFVERLDGSEIFHGKMSWIPEHPRLNVPRTNKQYEIKSDRNNHLDIYIAYQRKYYIVHPDTFF